MPTFSLRSVWCDAGPSPQLQTGQHLSIYGWTGITDLLGRLEQLRRAEPTQWISTKVVNGFSSEGVGGRRKTGDKEVETSPAIQRVGRRAGELHTHEDVASRKFDAGPYLRYTRCRHQTAGVSSP